MTQIRIETDGLTLKEARELEQIIQGFEEVEKAQMWPFAPGTVQNRSLPTSPQMGIPSLHVVIHLAEIGAVTAAKGVAIAAGAHLYKKVGESVVDKAWDAIKAKFSGTSSVEVKVKLFGPDGELIKEIKGRR